MNWSSKRMRQCWRGGSYREPDYSFGRLSWSLGTDLHEKVTRGWENCQKGAVKTIPEVLRRLGN